jgi:hypothetical protein
MQYPSTRHAGAFRDLAVSRDNALVLQIAQDHFSFIVATERGDKNRFDGRELRQER